MKTLSTLQFWGLCWFSKPACDRQLYKVAARHKPLSIVQFGLPSVRQAQQLVAVCQRFAKTPEIKFTGVDLFEARPEKVAGLTLKEAHRVLTATNAKIRLLPGDTPQILPRMANQLTGTDLLILSTNARRETLDACWFFVPRMMHDRSLLFLQCERDTGAPFEILRFADVENLAKAAGRPGIKAA